MLEKMRQNNQQITPQMPMDDADVHKQMEIKV